MGEYIDLFFALIVVLLAAPILAIIAFIRSRAVSSELVALRNRVKALEQSTAPAASGQTMVSPIKDAITPVAALPEPDSVVSPADPDTVQPIAAEVKADVVLAKEQISEPVRPEPPQLKTEKVPNLTTADRHPPILGGVMMSLVRWFLQGNPLAKLGILLLFFGISFLLRYTVEHSHFPLELRLTFSALLAMILLALGWWLRHKRPLYALILQGGATGALYLIVFGAFRFWQMLPTTLAFVLLLMICAASVGLAILQKSLSLAMLASLGGYLAPLLLSDGEGNYVALFSFYLMLSAGVLAISIWQQWRELNILGLLFTFGVGSVWGITRYRPEYYLICQFFLAANIIIFGVLSVLLSLRSQQKGQQIVDGVLLFVPPLAGFALQYAMTRNMSYGPALSALGYGGCYLMLAWLILRYFPARGKLLVLATLMLGGAFTTLAIPLALTAHSTAMAWALEGVGILWLGEQQQQRRMSYSGTALLVLALCSALIGQVYEVTVLSQLLVFSVLSLCWLAAAWIWRNIQLPGSWILLAGGLLLWIIALACVPRLIYDPCSWQISGMLGLMAVSCWIWRLVAARLRWWELDFSKWLLWPMMLIALLHQIAQHQIFAAGWPNLAWVVALVIAGILLWRDTVTLPPLLSRLFHLALFWIILLALSMELFWYVDSLPLSMIAWRFGLFMAAGGLVIFLVYVAVEHQLWPFRVWPALYACQAMIPVALLIAIRLLLSNFQDGVVYNQLYLPLINPLEEGGAFALLGLTLLYCMALRYFPTEIANNRSTLIIALLALDFWWLNGVLLRAISWYGDIPWRWMALWHSRVVQTCFALFWALMALVVMLHAGRRHSRQEWLCGAGLLGIVIVKLLLVDSTSGGNLARAVAFTGVAILVLVVGYFSPLPPKTGEEK